MERHKRYVRHAAMPLGVLLAATPPGDASAQPATTAFQDNYADVNGVRLHYASIGKGPLILFFVFNGYLAPGEQPVDESTTRETATRRAHTGFVDAEVRSGRYAEDDRQASGGSLRSTGRSVGDIESPATPAGFSSSWQTQRRRTRPDSHDPMPPAKIANEWLIRGASHGKRDGLRGKDPVRKTP